MFPVKAFCLRGFRGQKGKSRAVKTPVLAAADWRAIHSRCRSSVVPLNYPRQFLGWACSAARPPLQCPQRYYADSRQATIARCSPCRESRSAICTYRRNRLNPLPFFPEEIPIRYVLVQFVYPKQKAGVLAQHNHPAKRRERTMAVQMSNFERVLRQA
jgi:hypothetical protein